MISTLRNSSPRATSAWMSGVGVTTIPPRNTRFPDSTTCTAVLASHHVVMLHLQRLLLRNTLNSVSLHFAGFTEWHSGFSHNRSVLSLLSASLDHNQDAKLLELCVPSISS